MVMLTDSLQPLMFGCYTLRMSSTCIHESLSLVVFLNTSQS